MKTRRNTTTYKNNLRQVFFPRNKRYGNVHNIMDSV
jgi:hypothetical protein